MKAHHSRIAIHDIRWPSPPLRIVLVAPEIPPNTGNIARLCAATGTELHLVRPLAFSLDDKHLRRAGLDYWDSIAPRVHDSWDAFLATLPPRTPLHLFTTASNRRHDRVDYHPGDALVFGSESHGLPDALLAAHPDAWVGIPIRTDHVRSLNLSSAAAIALYAALSHLSP
ncbi:MAG: tRNA (cytidine(34)-2'-O)-methyltransferase [Kiritimatiellae bacterium]|nr:tRNA (cytidine(34)-2'-O)-methyltransferase [Kiritimatiellia bacterium]